MIRTNDKLAAVTADVQTLIGWAQADVDASVEADAHAQAADDRRRVKALKQALAFLESAGRWI